MRSRLVSRGGGVGGVNCYPRAATTRYAIAAAVDLLDEPVEIRPRTSCRALDVQAPRAGRRRERRRLRNAAGMAPHNNIRGIGEGPPIQVRYRPRVAHGLGPIELRLVAEVVG